jgi:DNA-binding response OmpR family regulator
MQSALNPSVLFVQTDDDFTQKAALDLQEAGYSYLIEKEAKNLFAKIDSLNPVTIVIDRHLAAEAAVSFCHQIRNAGNRLPILMLVNEETLEERIACLESGADDYLVKPYHREEFLQFIRFYLQPPVNVKEQLRFGDLVLDLSTRRLLRQERVLDLTMKEFELLKYLMSNPQKVLTREEILENVWGYDYRGESNVIEVYIRYLRLKIETEGQKRIVQTVRGVGYVLRES